MRFLICRLHMMVMIESQLSRVYLFTLAQTPTFLSWEEVNEIISKKIKLKLTLVEQGQKVCETLVEVLRNLAGPWGDPGETLGLGEKLV